eukprot:2474040-Pleurochrysis_carterae.AAC.1
MNLHASSYVLQIYVVACSRFDQLAELHIAEAQLFAFSVHALFFSLAGPHAVGDQVLVRHRFGHDAHPGHAPHAVHRHGRGRRRDRLRSAHLYARGVGGARLPRARGGRVLLRPHRRDDRHGARRRDAPAPEPRH